jgi:dephospho-CoA kinase
MGRRLRIGLTGGIASGKSLVAGLFAEFGVPVIDADRIARTVVEPGQPGLKSLIARFGAGFLAPDGSLDRRALRELIFSDSAAKRDLEGLLHPLIRTEMERQAQAAQGPYLLLEIPLLAEGGRRDGIDRVLVVDAEESAQIARLMARDGSSEQQARAILAAQASRKTRRSLADDVLENSGIPGDLRLEVARLHQSYLALASVTPH